jgi:hypothetical protein
MTDIGEQIAVDAAAEGSDDCWYCKEEPKDNRKTNVTPNPVDDSENDLENNSSTLGENLGKRPKWKIQAPHDTSKRCGVVPGAHHCIPGNASLLKATALLKFMQEEKGVIESDIGYDVNAAENGVWLPGSYGVNPQSQVFQTKWRNYATKHKNAYAIAAMESADAQFHDAHPRYSGKVLQTLKSIANKLQKEPKDKCPVCGKKKDKKRPPYGLVGRLHYVSGQHRGMLLNPKRKKRFVMAGYFTSSRVHLLFARRGS